MFLYGRGLCLSEVLEFVPANLDSKRMTVMIRCSMSDEDRVVPVPTRLLAPWREYYRPYSS